MRQSLLFDSWHQWKVCFLSGCKNFAWGLARIITCIILGVASIIRAIWRAMVGWVERYPNIALGAFIVFALLLWLVMYARNKAIETGLTAQKDSIAWQYQDFKEKHGYE